MSAFVKMLTKMGQPNMAGGGVLRLQIPQGPICEIEFWFRSSDGVFISADDLIAFLCHAPKGDYEFFVDILENIKKGKLPLEESHPPQEGNW